MRLQEEPQEASAQAVSPAPTRATAEEFAALEARKAERLSGPSDGSGDSTIGIAEAVRELGLDADPEDVWAEVQAQRARRARPKAGRRPARTRTSGRLVGRIAGIVGITALLVGLLMEGRVIGGGVIGPHRQGTVAAPVPWFVLSQIPDGVPVYAQGTDISGLLHGGSPAQMFVTRSSGPYHHWALIRHDGRVYLRGYVLPQPVQPGVLGRLSLYSVDGVGELAGAHSQSVTVPLDGAQWKDGRGADGWGEITLIDVETDGHFHEKW